MESISVQAKIKNGSAFPVAFHPIDSGRINAPHGGTEPYNIDIKNARDDERNPSISMESTTNVVNFWNNAKKRPEKIGALLSKVRGRELPKRKM